jgi:hypothetical protein
MCGGMILGAVVIALVTGNPFAFLPVLGCILMMVVMMQLMAGMSGQGERRDHDD